MAVTKTWSQVEGLSEASKDRLQAVVRLNSLGFYTHSEQLCHHCNFTALTGSGLFALASGFNHSCEPSVVRFSLGDITAFVTNRPIEAGEELCISYIESELLCAPTSLRSQSLNRDFRCGCRKCTTPGQPDELAPDEGTERTFMRVDAQVQANLSLLPAEERVEAVQAALAGQMGDESEGEEESEEEGEGVESSREVHGTPRKEGGEGGASAKDAKDKKASVTVLLGKDAQELRVVQAMALMQLGRHSEALSVWRRLAAFSCHHCPPFDEALAVYASQAALCALSEAAAATAGDAHPPGQAAGEYVALAVEAHRAACGADLFQWRYRRELEESVASAEVKAEFWRIAVATSGRQAVTVRSFELAISDWRFAADETTQAFDEFRDT
ncbi:unnamed protein product [Polarella glacialis]|uniref:SET domain-containing protein n=1 Tax=Polarella glacialis TaxID=89957 RepID=A0A813FMT2_POLGL|nr:unnamed protein product [Polarella glacialis]